MEQNSLKPRIVNKKIDLNLNNTIYCGLLSPIKTIDVIMQIFNSSRHLNEYISIDFALKYLFYFKDFRNNSKNPLILLTYRVNNGYICICNGYNNTGILKVIFISNCATIERYKDSVKKGIYSFVNIIELSKKSKILEEIPNFSGQNLDYIIKEIYKGMILEEKFYSTNLI